MSQPALRLPRVLSLFDFSVLASAAMGPAYSLAATAGVMIASAGSLAPVALITQTLIMLCIAVGFMRLAHRYPDAGSSYGWVRRMFGRRVGAFTAWLLLVSNFFATLTTAIPAGTYTLDLVAPGLANSSLWSALIGTMWIALGGGLLYLGARPTAIVSAVMLLIEIVVVAWLAIAGMLQGPGAHAAVQAAATPHAVIPAIGGPVGFVTATVLAIWMIDGWEVSASASEESAKSTRQPGQGGIAGLLLTCAILWVALVGFLALGDLQGFADHQADAMTYVAQRLGGGPLQLVTIATVLISTGATLSATMLYLSRSVYAMGRDGLIKGGIGSLDRRGTPTAALLWVSGAVGAATLCTGIFPSVSDALKFVLNGSSFFLGVLFALSAAAAARAFWSDPGRGGRLTGVALPLVGSIALVVLLAISLWQGEAGLRWTVGAVILAGVPFALWRGGRLVPISA